MDFLTGTPAKWTYFYLYVILDVFSRYVVGWMVAHRESAALAERFMHEPGAPGAIRRWPAPPAGASGGSVDQPTQDRSD